jgi:hypothetical protein
MVILIGGLAAVRSKKEEDFERRSFKPYPPYGRPPSPGSPTGSSFPASSSEARHLSLLSRPQTWAGLLAGPFFCLTGGRLAGGRADEKNSPPSLTFFTPCDSRHSQPARPRLKSSSSTASPSSGVRTEEDLETRSNSRIPHAADLPPLDRGSGPRLRLPPLKGSFVRAFSPDPKLGPAPPALFFG